MHLKKVIISFFYFLVLCALCYGIVISDFRIMFISMLVLFLYLFINYIDIIFSLNISFKLKLFIYFFLFCSEILGEVFDFYSIIPFWDNILHFLSSILFVYVGYLIFKTFIGTMNCDILFILFSFMFCFSISIAVLWEFVEYSSDMLLNSDMQKDNFVDNINTTLFSSVNNTISINNIYRTDIYTNDGILSLNGYLDLGLSDTIEDLLISIYGSFITSFIIILFQRKKT